MRSSSGHRSIGHGQSVADYQAALRTLAFTNISVATDGSRTVGFTVTDDYGAPSPTANETLSVAAAGDAGGVGGSTPLPTNLDAQQRFSTQFNNLTRAPGRRSGLLHADEPALHPGPG